MTTTSKRIIAIIIDFLFFTIFAFVSFMLISDFVELCKLNSHTYMTIWYWGLMVLFIMRDTFKIGFGKKIMGLVVKTEKIDDRSTSEIKLGLAGWRKHLLRNVTILIWPVELLMVIVNERRFGDMIAHTRVEMIVNKNINKKNRKSL